MSEIAALAAAGDAGMGKVRNIRAQIAAEHLSTLEPDPDVTVSGCGLPKITELEDILLDKLHRAALLSRGLL